MDLNRCVDWISVGPYLASILQYADTAVSTLDGWRENIRAIQTQQFRMEDSLDPAISAVPSDETLVESSLRHYIRHRQSRYRVMLSINHTTLSVGWYSSMSL